MLAAWLFAVGLGPAHVAAASGRVMLVREGRPIELVRPGREIEVASPAHLEVGAAAEACLSWTGVGSLRVTGPLALEWGTRGSTIRVLELGRVEIEVRSASATIVLPDERVCRLGPGAFRIEGGAHGSIVVETRAGAPARVEPAPR